MTRERSQRLQILVLVALSASCADLWVKAALPSPQWALHHRSLLWAFGCWLLLIGAFQLSRVPSTWVTIGAGLFGGGVLGNLISAGADRLVVPNPFMIQDSRGVIAFNLADASILCGNLVLMVALSEFVIRHRDRLPRGMLLARLRR